MDIVADVALLADVREPRVQAHANADRPCGKRPLSLHCRLYSLVRGGKDVEEGVTLCVHLHAATL
jgi:hypothetical protein